jgi:superfamily II DNA or RNA helicase
MKLVIETPIKAFIEEATELEMEKLKELLSYTNTANKHQLKRHYSNMWLKKNHKEKWEEEKTRLENNIHFTLIFEEDGRKFIRPGSIPYLVQHFVLQVKNLINYPGMRKVPWAKPLPFEFHPYQDDSIEGMVEFPHSSVELCTGAGKSALLLKMCREMGLKTAIVVPSASIFNELLEKFEYHLGRQYVGRFGDGRKKLGKLFTICIGDSVVNVEKGTPEWEFFSTMDMICVDESHTWGAETLETICHGVFANVPYRHFFSGTQTRGDGAEVLLQSIIGRIVRELPTWEAIDGGYICDHVYRVVDVESSDPNFHSKDILEMKRAHLLRNKNIAAFIAKLANAAASQGKQTLVLVDELSQIAMLLPLLKVPYAYAHSTTNVKDLKKIGLEKVDSAESVEKFNKNEVKVLIGTSCIATGTNIYPTHHTCNWVGGASEIRTAQGAIGRSVRLHKHNPYKDNCVLKDIAIIWDFHVYDIEDLKGHLIRRLTYYRNSRREIKRIFLNGQTQTAGGVR